MKHAGMDQIERVGPSVPVKLTRPKLLKVETLENATTARNLSVFPGRNIDYFLWPSKDSLNLPNFDGLLIYRVFSRDVIKFLNPKLKSHRCFYPHWA